MSASELTILLPLKGRSLYTLRWLWHANRTKFPFPIIIADGEVNPSIENLLSNPKAFPNLQFEYHRYNDCSYYDFYEKCVDALNRVQTKYVMMSDNDDFVFVTGVKKNISFLDREKDYVCAGGGVAGFLVGAHQPWNSVVGNIERIYYRYTGKYRNRDLDEQSIKKRVLDEIDNYHPIYYSVYRIDALRRISAEIRDCNFSDLHVHEIYWSIRSLTIGKVRSDPSVFSYFRQKGTSLRSSHDWFGEFLGGDLPRDVRLMASMISREVVKIEGGDPVDLEKEILKSYAHSIKLNLAEILTRMKLKKIYDARAYLGRILRSIQNNSLQKWIDKQIFWYALSADGASKNELHNCRKEFKEIKETIIGKDFIKFVKLNCPELIAVDK